MLLLRTPVASSTYNSVDITRVWGNDGWCYIPELRVRQRFSASLHPHLLAFKSEPWSGAMPLAVHQEQVRYSLMARSPLIWQEQGIWGSERYEETTVHTHSPSE